MKHKKILLISIFALLAFSIKLSIANIGVFSDDEKILFLPDCGGLLPNNYEYFEFLEEVAKKFIAENSKQSDKTAKEIFFLIGLRNSSVFQKQDNLSLNAQKDIDKLLAEKMCAFAENKDKSNLWSGSEIVKKWVAENINELTKEVENHIKLYLELKQKIALSRKEALKQKKKLNSLSNQEEKRAEKRIKNLIKTK
jgi:hypothetical protein